MRLVSIAFQKPICGVDEMLIYRFTSQSGKGVYSDRICEGISDDFIRHPMPEEEELFVESLKITEKWSDVLFGFNSLNQIKSWFNEKERHYLQYKNVHLKVFKVNKNFVRVTAKQAIFDPKFAEEVNELDVITFKRIKC